MNTRLLKLIRATTAREMERRQRFLNLTLNQSSTNELMHPLGTYRYAVNSPVFARTMNGLFFDSVGESNSKSGIAYRELSISHLKTNRHRLIVGAKPNVISYVLRLFRLIILIILFHAMVRRLKNSRFLSVLDASVVIGYAAFKDFLDRNPDIAPVIISDTSINYLIMAYAAHCNNGIFWWQDDIHHTQDPFFKLKGAAFISSDLYKKYSKLIPEKFLLKRNIGRVLKVQVPSSWSAIGVAVNATFLATESQIARIETIKKITGVHTMSLRLHPTVSKNDIRLPAWLKVSDPNEPIEDFALRHDLIFVGNSAIQIKIAKEGVATFHISGLDAEGYDLYGYVRDSIVFGEQDINENSMDKLRLFYMDDKYFQKLKGVLL